VFFSISDPSNKVRKLLTPGILLRNGVRREEYRKLHDKKDRRKKRSLRLFLNNQKRSHPACAQTWNLMYSFILERKLKLQKFVLILGGSNLKLSKTLGQNILRQSRLNITHIITKATPPHNGCPLKIKKRKKNKGLNKWLKRSLTERKNQLSFPRNNVDRFGVLIEDYYENKQTYPWLKEELKKAIIYGRNVRRRKKLIKISSKKKT